MRALRVTVATCLLLTALATGASGQTGLGEATVTNSTRTIHHDTNQSEQVTTCLSMYWDARGQGWAAGTNALATKLR